MELGSVTTEKRISEMQTKNKTAGETDREGERDAVGQTFETLPQYK